MKLRFLLIGIALLMTTMTVLATPAKPGVKKTVRQADGTTVELTLRGDEHFSFYTDDSGQAYRLVADGKLERLTSDQVTEMWTTRKAERLAGASISRSRSPRQAGKPSNVTTGKHRGLVILTEFQDVKLAADNPKQLFSRFFNEIGYVDNGNSGSVKDYFLQQSYGQLEIDFDIVGPYTAKKNLAYYGASSASAQDVRALDLILEAIEAASKEVDFTNYDWDGDGEVDQVFIICAGYDESDGASSDYIWPHEWKLSAQGINLSYNGKKIDTYGIATELWGTEGKNPQKNLAGIGTACHEFSHCLGLPDVYDTTFSGNIFGMGQWDVMDLGYTNNNGFTPAGYTSYERWFCGWLTPTELNEQTRINDMKPLITAPEAYILYNEANRNEYYLLENRQKVGFDQSLNGHGLLVLHVDYDEQKWTYGLVNTIANHQCMTIIPADGYVGSSLTSYAGDPFPGRTGNTELSNHSVPAATLYNANVDGRKLMNKQLDNITESKDGLISFVACRPELLTPQPDDAKEVEGEAAFTVTWPAISGAVGYEMEVMEMGKAPDDPKEALQYEFNFEELVSKSNGFVDISGKLGEYGLTGWSGSKLFTSPNKMRFGSSSGAGYVHTQQWDVPQSSEITIVMGTKLYDGKPVRGKVRFGYGNKGENITTEDVDFELTEDGFSVFHFATHKAVFWIEIRPESSMYLNYFAVYDGTWTAEQLGLTSSAARQNEARKATKTTIYETDTNSCTLHDQNRNNRFLFRVRAVGEDNVYSLWSEQKTFTFGGSSPAPVKGDANGDGNVNAADIVEMVNYIMGNPSAKFDAQAADVNGDGTVNAADIVLVVNNIMSAS